MNAMTMTTSATRRYLALHFPFLALDRLRVARPDQWAAGGNGPAVIVEPVRGAIRLASVDADGLAIGLLPAMTLADASAREPDLRVFDAQPHADQDWLERLCDGCGRYTPNAALDGPDGLMLDISGCDHLWGGEEALARDAADRLERYGMRVRHAIAASPEAAYALANDTDQFVNSVIQTGVADVMVAGGTESTITPLCVAGFNSMKALSTRNDDPTGASRPFDKDRDGFVVGEGSGVVFLEELESAKKRGAKIYAEVVGYGLNSDANHMTTPAPNGEGAARCMKMALKSGGINPEEVDYINAHGTSTFYNDLYETMAIKTVFGDHARALAISSTKGMTGHLLGAAGGVEAVFTALSLYNGVLPPTINYTTPDPDCDLDYVPNAARDARPKVALSNSFGFGGTNGVLVFKRFE